MFRRLSEGSRIRPTSRSAKYQNSGRFVKNLYTFHVQTIGGHALPGLRTIYRLHFFFIFLLNDFSQNFVTNFCNSVSLDNCGQNRAFATMATFAWPVGGRELAPL